MFPGPPKECVPMFAHYGVPYLKKLSDEQIRQVERRVNALIRANVPLWENRTATMDQAREMGAMALFGEKYGDVVRVVKFGDSVELCGGCHTSATGNIGFFRIVSEAAIAAGIRRIEAVTGEEAEMMVEGMAESIKTARSFFNNVPDLTGAIQKMIAENASFKKQAEELARQKAAELARRIEENAQEVNGIRLAVLTMSLDPALLRNAAMATQAQAKNLACIAAFEYEGKPQLMLMYSQDLVAAGKHAGKDIREAAKFIQGGGGGQPGLASAGGKDVSGLADALEALKAAATR
jgi:alanyl-tRNA synthetase